jgi:hypothetical protein
MLALSPSFACLGQLPCHSFQPFSYFTWHALLLPSIIKAGAGDHIPYKISLNKG